MPLSETDVGAVVSREVGSVRAIDVHTHLLPPTHGGLMLFGIDHLLTYHYLIAETFMVLPAESDEDGVSHGADAPPSPDEFFAWPVARQAELVFEELFVRRTPLSEACRGVVTVLSSLGLGSKLREAAALRERPAAGRLAALREWFAAQEPAAYLEKVFEMAGLRYAVMTNIPVSGRAYA